jgi:TetR/AcrR family transcriptional regulator
MPRPPRVSPDRILAVAALEFAERGFAGARVDRIARRAHVNKAMLYYHFKSKQGLYRILLRRMFLLAAERLTVAAAGPDSPAAKLDRAIAGIAAFIEEQSFFPGIMMREVAEGGAHLDRETLTALAAVPRAFGAIIHEGVAAGVFRPIDPVFAYFTVLPPVIFYLAGARIRREISNLHVLDFPQLAPAEFVRHMQETVRRSLRSEPDVSARPTP